MKRQHLTYGLRLLAAALVGVLVGYLIARPAETRQVVNPELVTQMREALEWQEREAAAVAAASERARRVIGGVCKTQSRGRGGEEAGGGRVEGS